MAPRTVVKSFVLRLAVAAVLAAILAGSLPAQNPGQAGKAEINTIFPIAPRELRQHLSRAQEAVAEERFSDAVAHLKEIFENPETNDFFVGAVGSADAQISLKSQALDLLGSMPAKGRQIYELDRGAEGRAALEEALSAGDLVQLTEVTRRFFHTKAGYEATLLLGRFQLDQGRPLAAALTLKRVADVPFAAAQYDPELSILLATCWVHANQPEQASATLVALKQRMPTAKVRLLDKEVPLFANDQQALAWLEDIVGGGRIAPASAMTQWVMFRGSETRNASTNGGVPLLNFNWKQRTVCDSPQDEDKVAQMLRAARDRGEPIISALQPLVVQDCVIVRHPNTNRLAGIDLKTGKIIWVFPPFDENQAVAAASESLNPRMPQIANIREQQLKQRVWEDNSFGQASSDGRQVYVIDEPGYAPMINVSMPQVIIAAGGRRIQNMAFTRQTNTLVALELKRQGYNVWAVGGEGDNTALSNAYFLGAPLPLGDQLYALAEQSGDIRLLCLNSRDGALEWKQQLAVVEEHLPIANDRVRRLAGASPSYADGVLVCPTSAGAVVAVDLVTRSLRWGYQYQRWDAVSSRAAAFSSSTINRNANQGHWLDGTVTIADGCVVLTPVESQELHCLDLLSGKARWPVQPRDDMLYVACVHDGKIVLVGRSKLKTVKLADGAAGWTTAIDLGDEVVTGRGYYSGKHYFLPVTGQHLLKIDLEEGKIVGRAKTEVDLGNVVCYKDHLISQSPQTVAAFYLSEPLQKQLDERLKANPNDAEALALQGQVLLQEGETAESLDVLRRAHQNAPTSEPIRSLLVKVMFALLRDDFSTHIGLTDELEKLVTDPAQRREALRWRVKGLTHTGKTWEAFQSLLELVDIELASDASFQHTSDALETIERDLAARGDRWLQGRLHELMRAADADTKDRMSAEINARLQRVLQSGSASQLRSFINLFGFQDAGHAARLALADQLIDSDQLLEAELIVGELLEAADPAVGGASRAALAALYERAKRPELAARYYRQLAAEYGDVICREGLTGKQLVERAAANDVLKPYLAAAWPTGQTEVTQTPSGNSERLIPSSQRSSLPIEISQFFGAAPRGLMAQYEQNGPRISIRDDLGRPLATASLHNTDPASGFRRISSVSYNSLSAKAHGHLVVVNLGTEVIAIDSLRAGGAGGDALLWRQDSADLDPAAQRTIYTPPPRHMNNPLVGTRSVAYDPTGRLNFHTGPVRTVGLCFQKGRQLICVDPLTGQSLWERSQIPPQAEIFGDEELLFIANASLNELLVLSAIDGTLVGKRKIDLADTRWTTRGRNVLTWSQTGTTLKLRLYDAWQPDTDLWTRQVPQGTKGCVIEGEELALLEPSGQFTAVSLASGQVLFAVPLDPEPALDFIQVLRSREQYVLIASQNNPSPPPGLLTEPLQTMSTPQARVHGRVYAFSRATGKLQWQVPAFVAVHCLPTGQPTESPLLLFVRNQDDLTKAAANKKSVSVLCLDKRDGRVVFDDSAGPKAQHCEIAVDPLKNTVTLSLFASPQGNTMVFQVTDKPAPPQPPAQTGDQASDKVGQLPGTVDPSVGAAIERLNRGENPAALIPGARFVLPPAVAPPR